ncbi:MAG: hypothetical protein LUD71_03040 [Clostridiales bacterium]|nr:hypothetical protein [Clostridiales bacterium]
MIKLVMQDKSTMSLSITMGSIRRLKETRPTEVGWYFNNIGADAKTTEEAVWRATENLYVGYLCEMEKAGTLEEALDYGAFLDLLPDDVNIVIYAGVALIRPNQTRDLEAYLKSLQRGSKKP